MKAAFIIICLFLIPQIEGLDAPREGVKSVPEIYNWAQQYIATETKRYPYYPSIGKRLLEEVVRKDPNHAEAHHSLGLIAYQFRHFDDAIKSFRKAAELNLEASQKIIGQMIVDQKVPDSEIDRCLAVCIIPPISAEMLVNNFNRHRNEN